MSEELSKSLSIFDPHTDLNSVALRWNSWLARFENYLIAANITNNERKKALLLHHAGEQVFGIYEKISKDDDNYNDVTNKLNKYFRESKKLSEPVLNKCGKCGRKSHNSDDECPAKGKQCTKCKRFNHFANVCRSIDYNKEKKVDKIDEEVLTKLVEQIAPYLENSSKLYKKCLNCGRKEHQEIESCPAKGKHCTNCKQSNHFANMCKANIDNNQLVKVEETKANKNENSERKRAKSGKRCRNCGQPMHGNDEVCPAKGKHCKKCNQANHFANMCKAKTKNENTQSNGASNNQIKITHVQNIQQNGPQFHFSSNPLNNNETFQSDSLNSQDHFFQNRMRPAYPSYPNQSITPYMVPNQMRFENNQNIKEAALAGVIGAIGAAAVVGLNGLGVSQMKKNKK